eukprot:CAMPEP_0201684498 /NCGR_PEP_ID=MMETSP0494-20130426/52674_1 /ASSEMBLY_ACC=CAM_ASM_000839 /TAXON_ID=420259 /ORGANISM="Thalassiosira gravida, Strain GMp14c1" /LENGTH=975 /DNA_ID=CAMNT_0048168309 /DNA_START=418 /DNA_END=3345 /DNA_ORIENTATION=-
MNPCFQRLLNRLSSLVALIGITRFCILCSLGEYDTWAMPLLMSASICKLLTTTTTTTTMAPKYHNSNKMDVVKYESQTNITMMTTWYQRSIQYLSQSTPIRTLTSLIHTLHRKLDNDTRHNAIFLSTILVIAPCTIYFLSKVAPLLSPTTISEEGINHKRLANDFGKLSSVALAFLLLPVSKSSTLFEVFGVRSEVHAIRLHIVAGCTCLFGGIAHGLYYTYIWIGIRRSTYGDVFPGGECYGGLWRRDYDRGCSKKFVNLLGIICGIAFLALGCTSLYWVRRRFYRVFYYVHIVVSVISVFGLAMHYYKMILYMAPSLLYYTASNVPVHVESLIKWWRSRRGQGGIQVSKVVCIPDSGGCVELSFRTSDKSSSSSSSVVANNGNGRPEDDFHSFRDTVGKYIKLHVPELSAQSHPFTVFTSPNHPAGSIQVLFRPIGSFTTPLSKRLRELASLPEPTPSEIENHHRHFSGTPTGSFLQHGSDGKSCPTMLVNGIRSATIDMFDKAMMHDRIVIVAGGVGIVSYISLIHALRLQATLMAMETTHGKKTNGKNNHYVEAYNNEENIEEGRLANGEINGNNIILGGGTGAAKRIDVHWMSRDEGLIRHVMQNYFVPFTTRGDSVLSNKPSISINIIVHHTSPQPSPLNSSPGMGSPNTIDGSSDSEATTTWRPDQHQRAAASMAEGGETTTNQDEVDHLPPSFASPTSIYEGNKQSLLQNLLPSVTFASIAFGGLWLVNYCFENFQDRHSVEMRAIAVVGILVLSLSVSLISNAMTLAGDFLHYKLLSFSYSKLDENGGSNGSPINDGIEIECVEAVPDDSLAIQHQFTIEGEDDNIVKNGHGGFSANNTESDTQSSSSSSEVSQVEGDNVIMNITHVQGRPNLPTIVRDVMMEGDQERGGITLADNERSRGSDSVNEGCGSKDVGIFMCGPMAMSDAVLNAVKRDEKERGLCTASNSLCNPSGRKPVAIYQEVFEL